MTNLRSEKGDTITLQGIVKRVDPETYVEYVVDITGGDVWFTAKRDYADLDADALIRKGTPGTSLTGISITDAVNGRFVIDILPEETEGLEDGTVVLSWDCQLREATTQISTIDRGRLFLMDQVTLAP